MISAETTTSKALDTFNCETRFHPTLLAEYVTKYGSTLTMKSKSECAMQCALSVNMSCDSFIHDGKKCHLLSITNTTGIELMNKAPKRIMPDHQNLEFYVSKFAGMFFLEIDT